MPSSTSWWDIKIYFIIPLIYPITNKPGDTVLEKAIQASFIIDTWDKVLFAYKYTHVFDQVELLLLTYLCENYSLSIAPRLPSSSSLTGH